MQGGYVPWVLVPLLSPPPLPLYHASPYILKSQLTNITFNNIIALPATHQGTNSQTDLVNEKDTIKGKGEYTAQWQCIKNDGWHIKRMTTQPIR